MARVPVERNCALLDPRRKDCSAEHLVSSNVHLKTSAIDGLKNVAKTFVEPTSSAAGDGGNGGAGGDGGAGVDGGAGGAGGGDGSIPPEPKKQKVSSDLEKRRLKRLAKSEASNASSSPSPVTTVRRSAIIEKEIRMYLAGDPYLEENDFSLLQFWLRRSKPSTCAETVEVEAGLPYLALIARLYNGIESTSCQAERNFSALSPCDNIIPYETAVCKGEGLRLGYQLRTCRSCVFIRLIKKYQYAFIYLITVVRYNSRLENRPG